MSRTNIIALVSAIALLLLVLELVRRRRLREEYSWLWLFAAILYLVTALWPGVSKMVASFIGTTNAALAFTFLGLQFLVLILIQYSVRLSQLTTQMKDLAQQVAILDCEQKNLNENLNRDDGIETEEMSPDFERYKDLLEKIETLKDELDTLSESIERV